MTHPTTNPSAPLYQLLIDRTSAALQSFAAGEIDLPAFRRQIDGIDAETRTLDLLLKLHRTRARLAARPQKPPKPPLSPSISNVCK
jgi:hypothetical protein